MAMVRRILSIDLFTVSILLTGTLVAATTSTQPDYRVLDGSVETLESAFTEAAGYPRAILLVGPT